MADNQNNSLLKGDITFIQNHIPALQGGEYVILVEQEVENTDGNAEEKFKANDKFFNEKRFAVMAERFSIKESEIFNKFPPENNPGEYDNVLPHIVFTDKSLPWVRSPDGGDNGIPWLALLLFEESEIEAQKAAGRPLELESTKVGDLQRANFVAIKEGGSKRKSSLPSDTISYPGLDASKAPTPVGNDGLDYGENWFDTCNAIDVSLDLFNQIAPAYASEIGPDQPANFPGEASKQGDLQLLAHARTVKGTGTKADTESEEYSVVVCNRMPMPNTRCVAHLVSFENLANRKMNAYYLPHVDNQGNYIHGDYPEKAKYIRLVSLKSWSFTSEDPKATFTAYLENLSTGSLQYPLPEGNTLPADVQGPLSMGFMAINHHTRQGDDTVSWYRGPLVPMKAPEEFEPIPDPDNGTNPLRSADQALRYNPDTGMLDVSYSAAWEIGRLLGIQNEAFSIALYNWKRANAQKAVLAFERQILLEKMSPLNVSEGEVNTQDLHKAMADMMIKQLKSHLTKEN